MRRRTRSGPGAWSGTSGSRHSSAAGSGGGWRLANPRFGDLTVLAPLGTAIVRADSGRPVMRGSHGYRPEAPEMGALFLAVGRGAARGARIGPVHSLDVAPTVLALLGIPPPEWMEGRPIGALLPGETDP